MYIIGILCGVFLAAGGAILNYFISRFALKKEVQAAASVPGESSALWKAGNGVMLAAILHIPVDIAVLMGAFLLGRSVHMLGNSFLISTGISLGLFTVLFSLCYLPRPSKK